MDPASKRQLKVSVLVPARNEVDQIQSCLESLLANDYPKDMMEVLVIDGMSEDGTQERVREIAQKDARLMLLNNPGRIVSGALNIGIRHAKGDIILRADAHTVFERDYVSQCVQTLMEKDCDNAGGPMRAGGQGVFRRAVALATSSHFGVGNSAFHFDFKEGYVDTVYLGAYKREVFAKIGLFDETFVRNQDDEFNFRLREAGGKIYLSPRIRSHYFPRSDFLSLWKQYFQYGYWKVLVAKKHWSMMRLRHFAPFCFIVGLLLLAVLGIGFPVLGKTALVLLGIYLAANILASTWIALREGMVYLPLLVLVYGCVHCAYGLGFGKGILDAAFHNHASF